MKKALSLVVVLCMLLSCCLAEETAPGTETGSPAELPSLWTGGETHTIEKKDLPMYIGSLDSQ